MPIDPIISVVMNDPYRPRPFQHTPISQSSMDFLNTRANRGLVTIAWIKGLNFGGWQESSGVWLDTSPSALCSTSQSPITLIGAVLCASYN